MAWDYASVCPPKNWNSKSSSSASASSREPVGEPLALYGIPQELCLCTNVQPIQYYEPPLQMRITIPASLEVSRAFTICHWNGSQNWEHAFRIDYSLNQSKWECEGRHHNGDYLQWNQLESRSSRSRGYLDTLNDPRTRRGSSTAGGSKRRLSLSALRV